MPPPSPRGSRPPRSARRQRPAPSPHRARVALHAPADVAPATARRLTWLAWAISAALVAGLLYMVLGPHRIGDYFTETDFYGAYAEGARLVQHGQLLPSRYGVIGPGYEMALALVGFLVPNLFLAAELLSTAAAAGALLLWFSLLRRRADVRVAVLAVAFMATNAHFFRYGYSATTDALALALQAAALWALLTRARGRAMAAPGALAAAASLTRYSAVYLLPAGLAAILGGGTLVARRGRGALLFVAGFLVPVAPWVVYSLAHGGGFTFQLHHNIAYDVFARAKGIPWDDYQKYLQPQFKSLWDVIARDPAAVAARMVFNVWDHLRLDALKLLGVPVAIAAAAGAAFALRDGLPRRLWPLGVAGALAFLALVPAFHSERYSLALLPLYAVLAAATFASPALAVVVGRGVWLKPALAFVPLGLALATSVALQAHIITQLPVEVIPSAERLRALARPGDKVIARKPHIAFLSGLEALPFPFADDLPDLGRYAHERGARWLYFSWPEAETRPKFWFLLDTAAVVPGLTVRYRAPDRPAVVYEIGPAFGGIPAWYANDTLVAYHLARARLMVSPRQPDLLLSAGAISLSLDDLEGAERYLMRASRETPQDVRVWKMLGEVGLKRSDPMRAAAAFRRALTIAPDDLRAREGLGWAAFLAGRDRDAAELWRPLVRETRNSSTLESMIAVFRATGDAAAEAEARAALRALRGTR